MGNNIYNTKLNCKVMLQRVGTIRHEGKLYCQVREQSN